LKDSVRLLKSQLDSSEKQLFQSNFERQFLSEKVEKISQKLEKKKTAIKELESKMEILNEQNF